MKTFLSHPTAFALIAAALLANSNATAAKQPNFIIILTDDHGYGDVSTYQETDVRTPHIDRIAREGIRFDAMRANCTVCSPTRAAMLTGRNADRVGVPGVIRTHPENSWGYFDPSVSTLADELNRAGYHTGLIGKWHLGLESPNLPNERGFDFFHGFLGDMMDDYFTHNRHRINYMRKNADVIEAEGHATEVFTDWTINYLQQRAAGEPGPFFLFLTYNAPHFPIQPPEEWFEKVRLRNPGMPDARAGNVAFVEHLDHHIGRVLDALDENGLTENTLLVFTSDNGGSIPHAQNNDPWRGGKQEHYDGGLRVPFMVRWPAQIPAAGGHNDYQGLVFDLFPTLLELAGAEIPEDIDAVSLVPAFHGKPIITPRDLYFVRREGGQKHIGQAYHALIRGDWKLLRNDPFTPYELYNLKDDPYEQTDLTADHPDVVKELTTAIRQHIQRGGATPWQPPSR